MPSFVEVVFQDADGRTGSLMLPVDDVALPSGYQAKIDALTAIFGGTSASFLTMANVKKTKVIIESAENATLPTSGDIRTTWEVYASATGHPQFRFQMPGRNVLGSLTTVESKGVLIDQSLGVFDSLVAALAPSTGLGLKDQPNGDSAYINAMRAKTGKRVTPRI